MVLKLAMVQTVGQYIFFYIGLAHTSGVKSSIIGASNVFLFHTCGCSHLSYGKSLSAKKVLGCAAGFAGVVLINVSGQSLDMNFSFLGEGFIFLSAVSYAFSSALIKRYWDKENPVTLSGWQFLSGRDRTYLLRPGRRRRKSALTEQGRLGWGCFCIWLLFPQPLIRCGEFS